MPKTAAPAPAFWTVIAALAFLFAATPAYAFF